MPLEFLSGGRSFAIRWICCLPSDARASPLRRSPAFRSTSQLPTLLARIVDPFGITWRVSNLVRRFSFGRAMQFLIGSLIGPTYSRPVLIVGMPRSGTTMLFHALRASDAIGSRPTERHNIWRRFHHPRKSGWSSDHVGKGEIRKG